MLQRFLHQQDQTAFELLVHRHGTMVLGLCRRIVGNSHDAEDAFQATFLTLARRAGSITEKHSLGSWLFKVAYRIALRCRSRVKVHAEANLTEHPNPGLSPSVEAQSREECAAVVEEVALLSDRLRTVLVSGAGLSVLVLGAGAAVVALANGHGGFVLPLVVTAVLAARRARKGAS